MSASVHWARSDRETSLDSGRIREGKEVRLYDTAHASFEPALDAVSILAMPDAGLRRLAKWFGRPVPKPRKLTDLRIDQSGRVTFAGGEAWASVAWMASTGDHPGHQVRCIAACYRGHRSDPVLISREDFTTVDSGAKLGGLLPIPHLPIKFAFSRSTHKHLLGASVDPVVEAQLLLPWGPSREEFRQHIGRLLEWHHADTDYWELFSRIEQSEPEYVAFDMSGLDRKILTIDENRWIALEVEAGPRPTLLQVLANAVSRLRSNGPQRRDARALIPYMLKVVDLADPRHYVIGEMQLGEVLKAVPVTSDSGAQAARPGEATQETASST
jgi:hypothetical protein